MLQSLRRSLLSMFDSLPCKVGGRLKRNTGNCGNCWYANNKLKP